MAHNTISRVRQMPDATRIFAIVGAILVNLGVFHALLLPPRIGPAASSTAAGTDDYLQWIVVPLIDRGIWRFPDPVPEPLPPDTHRQFPASSLEPISTPAPTYPIQAMREGITGTVELKLLVGTDGRVLEAQVAHSSGHRLLDNAAREQVLRSWRFRPVIQNGVAVQATGLVPIIFTLDP